MAHSLHCVMQDSSLQCMGSLVVVKGLQSTGSAVAARGLSCSAPHQGWKLHPHIARQILNHWTTREVARMLFVSEMDKSCHERLTDLAVVPREKPHTGAAAREQPRDSPVIER